MKHQNETFSEIVDKKFLEILFNGTNPEEVDANIYSFKMFDETYQTLRTSLFTFYRGYLNEILDTFILEAHQHGILEYLHNRVFRFSKINDQIDLKTRILTTFTLSAGFYVWLATVAFACIVFIGEHVNFYIKRRLNALKLLKVIPVAHSSKKLHTRRKTQEKKVRISKRMEKSKQERLMKRKRLNKLKLKD